MERRAFLSLVCVAPAALRGIPASATPSSRTFELTTGLELPDSHGPTRAWVPLALGRTAPFQASKGHKVTGNATRTSVQRSSGADMLVAEWSGGQAVLQVTMTVATTNHSVDLRKPAAGPKPADLARYLRPTTLIPLDGIVRETASRITNGHRTPLSRARAIYDWIVEHTVRDPDVEGCGLGDIRWMLETKNLRGKCADLNTLFVGLSRAVGLPARDLYGIRVAPSTQFPSLGRAGGNVTTAQHCRAEVYIEQYGWVPVDPADVRKLILEERAMASLSDPYVVHARETLFGSWEMNWIAFNDAHDVPLPGSSGKPLPFLMYPQAEAGGGGRRNSLDAAGFRYSITAREV